MLLASEFSREIGDYAGVVQQLLDKGAAPGKADAKGRTPLHYAAKNNDAVIAKLLIAKLLTAKTSLDARTTEGGMTPLHMAAQAGSIEVVKLLLADSADAMLADAKGSTPLQMAAAGGHGKIVDLLLPRQGITNDDRMAARKLALDNKHPEVVALLDQWWAKEITARVESSGTDPVKSVMELLMWPERKLGDVKSGNGGTLLAVAVSATPPNVDLVKLLINAEPTLVALPDAAGETPLYLAVRTGKSDLVGILAAKSEAKSITMDDKRGQRLLNVAVDGGRIPIVEMLLKDYKLPLNDADNKGQGVTPLQVAAAHHDHKMVDALLRQGAKADAKALGSASTPTAQFPEASFPDETIRILGGALLADQVQDPKTTAKSLTDILSKLDQLKLDLLGKPLANGQLPFEVALRSGSVDAQTVLFESVKKKNYLDKQNAAGETALHVAALLGQVDAVQGILSAGANYSVKDKADHTPEEAAKAASQKGTETALAGYRMDVVKGIADREKAAADVLEKQKELDKKNKDQADLKATKDAVVAQTWFDHNLDKDQHKNLAIAGVDEIQFLPDTEGGLVGAAFGALNNKISFKLKGTGTGVSCVCRRGLLTVIVEGEELPNMGSGDVSKTTRPSGKTKVVGYKDVTVKELFGKSHRERQAITEPDGSTVPITVHTYAGPITTTPDGGFEWNVPPKPYKLSMEKR